MSKEKFRIEVIDFLPMCGKVKTDLLDESGEPLCVGDAIDRQGEKMLIGYRYGQFVLLPMFAAHYIGAAKGIVYRKINTVVAAPGMWLIVGYTDEPFYQEVKDVKDISVIPAN